MRFTFGSERAFMFYFVVFVFSGGSFGVCKLIAAETYLKYLNYYLNNSDVGACETC